MNSLLRNPAAASPSLLTFLLLLLLLLFLSGCARKPWGDALGEEAIRIYADLFDDMRKREMQCTSCMDGDINLFLTSRFGNRAGAGYFQLMQPDHVKFIASNPFGQPLLLFTSNGQSFQYINTAERQSLSGDVTAFFQSLDAPPALASSSWGEWITGRLPLTGSVEKVRRDEEGRGIWLTIPSQEEAVKTEHLLIDTESRRLLSRIVAEKEKIALQIDYLPNDEARGENLCGLPETLQVTGFDYGTKLTLEISKPGEYSGCSPADFILRVPSGYTHREIVPRISREHSAAIE